MTIPPDIMNDDEGFTDGYQALEGGSVHLRCRATGEPQPEVSWKREDGKPIILRRDKKIGTVHNIMNIRLRDSRFNLHYHSTAGSGARNLENR